MKHEKGHSTKIRVTGCEAQATTSDTEVVAQQSFDSWVAAMEADWLEEQVRIARIAIERSRERRRMAWVEANAEV